MKQREISRYLKVVTAGVTVLFLIFVVWFMPSVLKKTVLEAWGKTAFWASCCFLWVTAVPCLLSLYRFWGICVKIGEDQSFSRQNAEALKRISHYMLADSIFYALFLACTCIFSWYTYIGELLFGTILVLFICVALTVLSAALSHLVYKASQLQEDQDLTI